MATASSIEWTEATWNPLTGCTKLSAGCKYCYADRMAKRLQAMGSPNYRNGFKITLHEHMLDIPFTWKKPRKVFVNSMSDLFHPEVPGDFIHRVFDVMVQCPQHQFQVLTKRPERVAQMSDELLWQENIWMGTSVEDLRVISRIDHLRKADAETRFLSLEPLLGPLPNLNLAGIHWVIVGGESGPKARPIDSEWVTDIRDQCLEAGVPFFFKQWGGRNKKKTGRLLEGRTWDEFPEVVATDQRELVHA
jgi:protein gp37